MAGLSESCQRADSDPPGDRPAHRGASGSQESEERPSAAGSGQREHHSAHGASRSHADLLEQELWGRGTSGWAERCDLLPGPHLATNKAGTRTKVIQCPG